MKILIGFDGSASSRAVFEDLPRAGLPDQGEMRVLCAAELPRQLDDARENTQTADQTLRAAFPRWTVTARAAEGSAAQILLDASDTWKPDLLAVGSHGRSGFTRFLLGSVSHRLAVGARCSVRIGRGGRGNGPLRILVASDGSPHAAVAVQRVAARTWPADAEFLTATVTGAMHLDPSSGEFHEFAGMQIAEWEARRRAWADDVAAEAARTLAAAGLRVSPWSASGEAARVLLEKAAEWNATCIFVGAEGAGQTGEHLLGSAATAIVQRAQCSVEIVR